MVGMAKHCISGRGCGLRREDTENSRVVEVVELVDTLS